MEIKILSPKAVSVLKNMEDLKLISIKESSETQFINVLKRIRNKSPKPMSLKDITNEIEIVRTKRYA